MHNRDNKSALKKNIILKLVMILKKRTVSRLGREIFSLKYVFPKKWLLIIFYVKNYWHTPIRLLFDQWSRLSMKYDNIVVKINHLRHVSSRQHAQQAPARQAQQSSAPCP